MPERGFFIFFKFFCNFFRNFLAEVEYERNSGLKFFSPFLGLCHPVLAKNIAGKRFFRFFWIFLQFFLEFSYRGPVPAEFRQNFFFSLSQPISSRFGWKYCLKEVFKFFEFFCHFIPNFLNRVDYEWNSGLKFFPCFLAYLIP